MNAERWDLSTRCRRLPHLLLLIFFALGMVQATHASITFDEGPHLAVGYTTLRSGDLRLQPIHIHPPLANVLAAAPLLVQDDLPDPRTIDGWEINSLSAVTDAVIWQYPHPRRIAVAGRVPILLLGVLLGALISRWAREIAGSGAAVLALALFSFDPNFIAHSAVITTDLAAVFFMIATLYVANRLLARDRSHRVVAQLLLLGFLLGLAQLTKVSALLLIPFLVGLTLVAAWVTELDRSTALRQAAGRMVLVLAVVGVVVWAGYGFEIASVDGLPLDIPAATHLEIYRELQEHYELGHPSFALGRVSDQGWWWYFPVAFVLKTPLPVLLLLLTAMVIAVSTALRSRRSQQITASRWLHHLTLGAFPLAYGAASLFSTVNIGYRHLLPLLPFIYIGIAKMVAQFAATRDPRRSRSRWSARAGYAALTGLLLWLIAGTLLMGHQSLSYFNELAGGPAGGYRYLADSNLDWGQNLWDLRSWLESQDEAHVYYAHYSPARPDAYIADVEVDYLPPDPRAVPFTPWHPAPGLYAIGATVLQGAYTPEVNTFAWFRQREPVARLGHALFIYRVSPRAAPTWLVECTHAFDAVDLQQRVGAAELRIIKPDCEQVQVYPDEPAPGLLVLPPTAPAPQTSELWIRLRTADGRTLADVLQAHRDTVPPTISASVRDQLVGPATFLGHTLADHPQGRATAKSMRELQLQTYWQVTRVPTRPLSLMAHLVTDAGSLLAVGDGLGFPIEQWQVGDLIVQTHRFPVTEDIVPSEALSVEVGGYWLDTMERWPTDGGGTSITLDLHLHWDLP